MMALDANAPIAEMAADVGSTSAALSAIELAAGMSMLGKT